MAKIIIFDLEATCWKSGNKDKMQAIEFGAVQLDPFTLKIVSEFQRFVRPTLEPVLSEFCKELTGIKQDDVNVAEPFLVVFREFCDWIGEGGFEIYSWGEYDLEQLKQDCKIAGIKMNKRIVKRHQNLKAIYAERFRIRRCGMAQALDKLHIPLTGSHHRAIDDARNIAKIAGWMLKN
jgi:inhibitor of KinA sporulation pathway (predicted exonuclease)